MRCQLRHEGLDLAPALATSPGQDGLVVLGREVPPQQSDGGQRHRARDEVVEDHGKTSAGSSRLDPVTGGVLGQEKHLRAVAEERYVEFGIMRTTPFEVADYLLESRRMIKLSRLTAPHNRARARVRSARQTLQEGEEAIASTEALPAVPRRLQFL